MKFYLLTALLLTSIACLAQQTHDDKYLSNVKTLDSTIETLYASISGEKGVKRDWDLFRYLFVPEARLIPSGKDREGKIGYRFMSTEDYIASAGTQLEANGFFEKASLR